MPRLPKGLPIVLRTQFCPYSKLSREQLFRILSQELQERIPHFPIPLSAFAGGEHLRSWPKRTVFTVRIKDAIWKKIPNIIRTDFQIKVRRVVPLNLSTVVNEALIRKQLTTAIKLLKIKQVEDGGFREASTARKFVTDILTHHNPELRFTDMDCQKVNAKRIRVTMVCMHGRTPIDLTFDCPSDCNPFVGK